MKILIITLVLILNCNFSVLIAQEQNNGSVKSIQTGTEVDLFSFLPGDWLSKDSMYLEKWVKLNDTTLTGEGWSLKYRTLQLLEELTLLKVGEECFYIADVKKNPAPVSFKLSEIGENSFTFSNEEHDYPNHIEYAILDSNTINVTLRGKAGSKSIEFNLKRSAN